jgi:hypothetical protein
MMFWSVDLKTQLKEGNYKNIIKMQHTQIFSVGTNRRTNEGWIL